MGMWLFWQAKRWMLTLVQSAAQAKCRSTDGTGKAVVLPSNIEHVEQGATGEFRHKYATTVPEHRFFGVTGNKLC